MPNNYFETVPKYIKLSKYVKTKRISKSTVCYWLENGYIDAKEIDGVLYIKLDEDRDNSNEAYVCSILGLFDSTPNLKALTYQPTRRMLRIDAKNRNHIRKR